jgi:hypothetical protein
MPHVKETTDITKVKEFLGIKMSFYLGIDILY